MEKAGNNEQWTNKPYKFECGSEELRKVLYYYGLFQQFESATEKIVCPFHEDINPSMLIDLDNGSYFCFGCNAHGDALKFVREIETRKGLSVIQAAQKYFRILNSEEVEKLELRKLKKRIRQTNNQALAMAHDYYYGLLTANWEEDERPEAVECREYMLNRGFSPQTLNQCKAKITYNRHYPIIFPMLDNGEFKGWVSRTTIKSIEERRKYLYNEGFSRASTVVGDYGSQKFVVLVEGYMDRLKFVQFGMKNNLGAILGWRITPEQIAKLKAAGVSVIVSALDNDKCGKDGTKLLKQSFKVVQWHYLDGVKDPGQMDKKQFDVMKQKTWNELKPILQY